MLRQHGVNVVEFDKSEYPEYESFKAPDAVFPNNWFGTHEQEIWLYRMKNPSRTIEKIAICEILPLLTRYGHAYKGVRSWHQSVIEGTGVLLFDRRHRRIYINRSQRADNLLEEFCRGIGYEPVIFQATSQAGSPFYHTNVMLSIGDDYAVVSSYSIDAANRSKVIDSLAKGKDRVIIEVDATQTEKNFCANILQLQGRDGPVIAMSQRAHDGFTQQQRELLSRRSKLAVFPLDVIETVGGGSARCMIAELFLDRVPPPHKH